MAATYAVFSNLVVIFLELCTAAITPAIATPGSSLINQTTLFISENSVNSLWCRFNVENVDLVLKEFENITLSLNGTLDSNLTLFFEHKLDPVIKEPPNITLESGQINETHILTLEAFEVGHSVLVVNSSLPNMTEFKNDFLTISVLHTPELDVLSDIVGWVYFVAWSISFYPQTYINWRRKSVIGLHFDFLALNTLGFFMYSIFNICLYWAPLVKKEYFQRHPYGVMPVQLNDVIFAVHAFFACLIQIVQCIMYERGDQQVSKIAKGIFGALLYATGVMLILKAAHVIIWLDFLYFVSYVKLFITLIKYIPQAYYNYRRKSTSGWSIGNILLDFTGGSLSILQMFILAYNYNDWGSIFGDPTKFGLGLFSIIFDVFFMVQHYCLYRGNDGYRRDLNSPIITHSSSLTESVSSVDYGSTGMTR